MQTALKASTNLKRIGIYTIGDASVPSTWFRIVQYLDRLKHSGVHAEHWGLRRPRGGRWGQLMGLLEQGLSRQRQLAQAHAYDLILLQKGLTPGRFRGMARRLESHGVPYVLDLDDAVYMPNPIRLPGFLHGLQDEGEFMHLLRGAARVIAGNRVIADYVLRHRADVDILPTPIDTDVYVPKPGPAAAKTVIGWSGSTSTNILVNRFFPILKDLAREHSFTFLIISNDLHNVAVDQLQGVDWKFLPWQKATEVEDLRKIDIGIMPLDKNDEWSRAKCGLKALQYMALGEVAVCSPVGINCEIIADGQNGFLADEPLEWKRKLKRLLAHSGLRHRLGQEARRTVEDRYSVQANFPKFLEILERARG